MAKATLLLVLLLAFNSCKKDRPSGVMIRIENNTSFTLDSVKLVYDTTHHNFGTIPSGKATGYVFFESMPDAPAATADSLNKKILAGHFIPPNSYQNPTLANGKYTLEIFPDATLFYSYGAKFVKD